MTAIAPITASPGDRPVLLGGVTYARLGVEYSSYEVVGVPALAASLDRSGEHWTVVDRVTGVHGIGDVPSAAIEDFARALREHLAVLEQQDSLSDDLVRQLEYLRERLAS